MEDAVTSEDAEPLPVASQNTDIHLREPEDECPSSASLEPSSPSSPLSQQTQGSAVSALQSKVKALPERTVVWKEPGSKNQDKRVVPGSFILGYAYTDAWGSSSSDEDGEPRKPLMFLSGDHNPQVELDYDSVSSEALLAVPRSLGEGASLENLSSDARAAQDNASPSNKPWMPPKCFWRSIRPEMQVLNGNVRRYNPGEVGQCGLWRADSLESMSSSGSSLSLAERVEMNRGLLKQMLQNTQNKDHVPGQRIEDPTHACFSEQGRMQSSERVDPNSPCGGSSLPWG